MRVPAFAPFFWLSYENLVDKEFTIGEQGHAGLEVLFGLWLVKQRKRQMALFCEPG